MKLMCIFLCLVATIAQASLGSKQTQEVNLPILNKPLSERLNWLKQDRVNVKLVEDMAFHEAHHLKDRWTALYSLVALQDSSSKTNVLRASKSRDWFMRDASLKLATKYYPKFASRLSRKLLKDPSLIVRTTAVKSIHANLSKSDKVLLWEALSDPINFRKGKSLWIRKHIVSALSDLESKESLVPKTAIAKFAKLVEDADPSVSKEAIRALEVINKTKLGSAKTPFEIHKKRWVSWWKDSQ